MEVARTLNQRFQITCDGHGQFFTLFYGVYDVAGRRLRYVSAGHPPVVVLTPSGQCRVLECQSPAIGCYEEAEFEEGTIDLAAGERLFLYSDGVSETMDGSGNLFGNERLVAACAAHYRGPVEQLLPRLVTEMAAFRRGAGEGRRFGPVMELTA